MNWTRWLIRASQWARNPPSWQRVLLVVGVIAACLAIGAFEWVFGWPEWLVPQKVNTGVPKYTP